jgi:type IV secretory pathway TrbD component
VRPLASPVRELRTAAVVQGAGCTVAIVLVALLERASVVGAVVLAALGAAIFGVAVWLAAYRRFLADALADPAPDPPGLRREAPGRTLTRTVVTTLPLVIVVVGMAILVPGVAGVLLGNAVALTLMARGMRDWQRREGALLLREPRYRTSGPDGRTGRGFLDPVDFYRADLRG